MVQLARCLKLRLAVRNASSARASRRLGHPHPPRPHRIHSTPNYRPHPHAAAQPTPLLKLDETGDVPALPWRFHCAIVVVPAHVRHSFLSGYAVEDGKTRERCTGPPATSRAGHLHPLLAGLLPRVSQRAAGVRWIRRKSANASSVTAMAPTPVRDPGRRWHHEDVCRSGPCARTAPVSARRSRRPTRPALAGRARSASRHLASVSLKDSPQRLRSHPRRRASSPSQIINRSAPSSRLAGSVETSSTYTQWPHA